MDVLDAGVYVSRFEAKLSDKVRPVLWGPLQAKELGLEGWEVQDAGETGMVLHHGRRLAVGRCWSTLIVVNRLRRAFLTVLLAGYPSDAPEAARRTETLRSVSAAQVLLGRIARETVAFGHATEVALVDHAHGGPPRLEEA